MHYKHATKVGRWTVQDGGLSTYKALKDGTPVLSAEQMAELELRAAITVLSEVELVGGAELKFARKAMGLKQTELAEHLGVNAETVSRWETGTDSFKRPVQLAILQLLTEFKEMGRVDRPLRSPRASDRVLEARVVARR
jgi:DNA-binding transcriptional regulator YiaG